MDELEAGLGVVVQATDHAWINLVGYAHIVQHAGNGFKVLTAFVIEVVEHQGGVGKLLLDFRALVIQYAQRIDLCAVAGFFIQVELKEEFLQLLTVSRAAIAIAQAGELKAEAAKPQRAEGAIRQSDDLGV